VPVRIYQGIDIIGVARIKEIAEKQKQAFLKRVFSPGEIEYCGVRRRKYEHYAARFAAKEAFIKAVSEISAIALPLNEIEVAKHATGKPFIKLSAALRKKLRLPGGASIELSLSHERDYAVASVLIVVPEKGKAGKK